MADLFVTYWPGPLLLVWGPVALKAAKRHLEAQKGGTAPDDICAAMQSSDALALVYCVSTATPTRSLVQRLYGASPGYEPTLLVDASVLQVRPRKAAVGARLPATQGLAWVTTHVAEGTALYAALPLPPLLPTININTTTTNDEDIDDDPTSNYCTSFECLLVVDPEIHCDRCGAAFCSTSCKHQATHLCLKEWE